VLAVARGTNAVQAAEVSQGHIGDAHARASGKLLLAYATPEVRQTYLDSRKLTRITPSTITSREALEREFEAIRERGYSEDDEEFALGLCCLAVPLDGGYSPFALSLSAPRERFVEERDRYIETLRRAAQLGLTGQVVPSA
jgi:DNA-binding IclR family transcriptional regulator